jgi:hypothetical protein
VCVWQTVTFTLGPASAASLRGPAVTFDGIAPQALTALAYTHVSIGGDVATAMDQTDPDFAVVVAEIHLFNR